MASQSSQQPVRFERLSIVVRQRPMLDSQGRQIVLPLGPTGLRSPYPLEVGGVIGHWAAPRDAERYFALAYAHFHDDARIAQLTAGRSASAQSAFMREGLTYLKNGMNCLNIVAMSDPLSLAVYHRFVSGPPFLVRGEGDYYEYRKEYNYGGAYGWFVPNYDHAVLYGPLTNPPAGTQRSVGVAPPTGLIPRKVRSDFDRLYRTVAGFTNDTASYHPVLFVPPVGFTLAVAPDTQTNFQLTRPAIGSADYRPLSVDLHTDVINDFWLLFQTPSLCVRPATVSAFPVLYDLDPMGGNAENWARLAGQLTVGFTMWAAGGGRSVTANGRLSTSDDWNNFRFIQATTEINPNVELPACPGAAEYLPYLRAWTEALITRSAEDAIQDTRAFVVYQNIKAVIAYGGLAVLMRATAGTAAEIAMQQHASDPTLQATAQAAMAIGTAFGPYGMVIGGIVGAGLMIADTQWIKPVTGHGKDDQGRWKPPFNRAWLSGDGSADPRSGPPHFCVDAPPASPRSAASSPFFSIASIEALIPPLAPKMTLTPAQTAAIAAQTEAQRLLVERTRPSSKAGWIIALLAALGIAKIVSSRRKNPSHARHHVLERIKFAGPSRAAMTIAANAHTRDELISALEWNDRNGVYSDVDTASEGLPKLTKAAAVKLIVSLTH